MKPILTLLLLFSFYFCSAQAWVKKKGESFSLIGYSTIAGDSKYNGKQPEIPLTRKVTDQTFQLYHEHGVSNKLTVISSIPLKYVSTANSISKETYYNDTLPAGNLFGFGNIELSLLYSIKQKGIHVTTQVKTSLNTSKENFNTGLRTGSSAWGIAPYLHFGGSTNKIWSSYSIGVNLRSSNYSNQWLSQLQIGTKIKQKLHVIGVFDIVQSMYDRNKSDENFKQTGLYTNNNSFWAYSLKFGYESSEQVTIWFAAGGGLYGVDVLRSPAYSLGISLKRNN